MSRVLLFAGALGLLVGGCASSHETDRQAEMHEQRAREAAAYENYDRAAMEKREAERLHAKAARERAQEATNGNMEAPPPPAPAPTPEVYPPPPAP